jgi:hypothetical protein
MRSLLIDVYDVEENAISISKVYNVSGLMTFNDDLDPLFLTFLRSEIARMLNINLNQVMLDYALSTNQIVFDVTTMNHKKALEFYHYMNSQDFEDDLEFNIQQV